jgi:hypothetical protein
MEKSGGGLILVLRPGTLEVIALTVQESVLSSILSDFGTFDECARSRRALVNRARHPLVDEAGCGKERSAGCIGDSHAHSCKGKVLKRYACVA